MAADETAISFYPHAIAFGLGVNVARVGSGMSVLAELLPPPPPRPHGFTPRPDVARANGDAAGPKGNKTFLQVAGQDPSRSVEAELQKKKRKNNPQK